MAGQTSKAQPAGQGFVEFSSPAPRSGSSGGNLARDPAQVARNRADRGRGAILPVVSVDAHSHPYDRHVGRYGRLLADGLVELAEISPGDRVLDVGCGTGQLTIRLAELVGGEYVAAIDLDESAIAVCRSRVPEADARIASAQDLPFAADEFGAVLAQLVVNLVDDPPAAVREMARVAAPGAVVVACFWDDDDMPLLRSFWDAAASAAPWELARVNAQAQVGVDDLSLLREWWSGAGLRNVELGEFEVTAAYDGFEDLWAPFEAGIGHSGRLYASLAPDQQRAMQDDARERLGSPEGPFRLTARVRTVRGTA
jgi:SAM-dependent methyltransferase